MTTSTIEEEIESADDAFLSAISPKEINGIALEPFSLMRQAVSVEIAGLNTETAFYEAVIRVWLCTLKPVDVLKAKRDKDQAVIDAFAWASSQGISIENGRVLMELYRRINAEIAQSTNAIADSESSESPNVGGRPS
jgi:hypothetical protein